MSDPELPAGHGRFLVVTRGALGDGVNVWVEVHRGDERVACGYSGGRARFDLPPGTYRVTARHTQYDVFAATLSAGGIVTLTSRPRGRLHFDTLDALGGRTNIWVEVHQGDARVCCGFSGGGTWFDLLPGAYRAEMHYLQHDRFAPEVAAGGELRLRPRPRGRIAVESPDALGAGANVWVEVKQEQARVCCGYTGGATSFDLLPGSYDTELRYAQLDHDTAAPSAGQTVTVRGRPRGRLAIETPDREGKQTSVWVEVHRDTRVCCGYSGTGTHFDLLPGTYQVQRGDFTGRYTATVEARATTKAAVRTGIDFLLRDHEGRPMRGVGYQIGTHAGRTGDDGAFAWPGASPGMSATLILSAGGRQEEVLLEVTEPDGARDRPLQPAGRDEWPEAGRDSVEAPAMFEDPADAAPAERELARGAPAFPVSALVPSNGRPYVLQEDPYRFVCMDVGRWTNTSAEARDFGVVWGRHVYLCRYRPRQPASGSARRPGLDQLLFSSVPGIEVRARASADWAPDSHFDWTKLHLIIPDLHLMTRSVGRRWIGDDWCLEAELDLLELARHVTGAPALRGKVSVVQLGDLVDLWVGCNECLFEHTRPQRVMRWRASVPSAQAKVERLADIILCGGPDLSTSDWVRDTMRDRVERGLTHGMSGTTYLQTYEPRLAAGAVWRNPAAAALELLEQAFGVTYVYGNHDNYTILPSAHWAPRRCCFEVGGVFMEHGHRLEAFSHSVLPLPTNIDGDESGYLATAEVYANILNYRPILGEVVYDAGIDVFWTNTFQRPDFERALGGLWLGRLRGAGRAPHVMVVAHTHRAKLAYIDVRTRYDPTH
jgi:hypothetical protein